MHLGDKDKQSINLFHARKSSCLNCEPARANEKSSLSNPFSSRGGYATPLSVVVCGDTGDELGDTDGALTEPLG